MGEFIHKLYLITTNMIQLKYNQFSSIAVYNQDNKISNSNVALDKLNDDLGQRSNRKNKSNERKQGSIDKNCMNLIPISI